MINTVQMAVLNFALAMAGLILAGFGIFIGVDLLPEAFACLLIATVEAIWLDVKTIGKVEAPF